MEEARRQEGVSRTRENNNSGKFSCSSRSRYGTNSYVVNTSNTTVYLTSNRKNTVLY